MLKRNILLFNHTQISQNLSFLPDVSAVFTQIDIAVGIDLYVLPVAGQQQIQDVVAIEFRHSAPTAASNGATLQFLVVIRIDPVYKRFDSYLISHLFFQFVIVWSAAE